MCARVRARLIQASSDSLNAIYNEIIDIPPGCVISTLSLQILIVPVGSINIEGPMSSCDFHDIYPFIFANIID